LLAVATLALAGCGTSATSAPSAATSVGASGTPAPTSAPACQDAKSSGTVTPATSPLTGKITVWEAYGASGKAERDAFCTIVANVKAANPGLSVDVLDVPFSQLFNNFKTQAAAGAGPDLYIAPNDDMPVEARASLLRDLTSLKDKLTAAPFNISQTALTADTVDGKLVAIPESMKAVALFYNKSIFTTVPASTADWLTNASKLGWVYGANGGGSYYLWGLFGSFGGKILDDSGKCAATATGTGGGVAAALKWLSDAKAAGMKFYQNDNDAKADFIAGKIGGFIDGPWQSGDLKASAIGANLAVAPGPTGPGGAFQPMAAPDGYYINASSKNADLATNFALQMVSGPNVQISVDQAGHIPANTSLTVSDPIANGFATAIKTGFARPTAAELNNYWSNFGDALVKVIDAGKDPTTAVADACSAMDKANKK
jgi:arabinogalactan oligomer/maltooligosaccharide transport system substrate-binding protein